MKFVACLCLCGWPGPLRAPLGPVIREAGKGEEERLTAKKGTDLSTTFRDMLIYCIAKSNAA